MNIKTINDLLSYVETEEKAQSLINYINSLENYVKMKEIDIREFSKENYYNKLEIERLNNIINDLEHDFESYELEYLQETYQGSLADFIETELERIKELKGSD